jgi:hypothetical protein
MKNSGRSKVTGAMAGILAATAIIGFAAASCDEKKDVSQKSSEAAVVTNENGSVSRTFAECTVSTNGGMVTEHRRETRTTLDADGNVLATTSTEYAQTYPVGDTGMASLASRPAATEGGASADDADSFMGLKFGEVFASTNFFSDAGEPSLLCARFVPKKALAGFDDYFVYVTPKTHKVVKVYACAKDAVDSGSRWSRNYLIEALERRYRTWARPRHFFRPVYTFVIGPGRYVTACLAGYSDTYETVLAAWDDSMLTAGADEAEEIRREARKTAAERRSRIVSDAADAF